MSANNSYIVHAFKIHDTTGVGILDQLLPDSRLLVSKQIFRIDTEYERWKPLFEDITTHLRDLRTLNGDKKHQMWDTTRFSPENGPPETQYENEISQIIEKVYELCKILITTTKDSLMYKIRSVTSTESLKYKSSRKEMQNMVTTQQVVQYWNLLKYWLKYLCWVNFIGAGVQIPSDVHAVLSMVRYHIDECILQQYHIQVPDYSIVKEKTLTASRLIPSRIPWHNLDLEEHLVLFTNALNACTEMSLYFHMYPKLKELMFQEWAKHNKQFVDNTQKKLPQQVKTQYETEIEAFTKYAKQEYIFCFKNQRKIIDERINENNETIRSKLKQQANASWHSTMTAKIELADLEADYERVRHKCIEYARTLANDYQISDALVKMCEHDIDFYAPKVAITATSKSNSI